MQENSMRKTILGVFFLVLCVAAVAGPVLYLRARSALAVANANIAALQDTTRIVRTERDQTAARLAFTQKISGDSISKLGGSLSRVIDKNTELVAAVQRANVTIADLKGRIGATADSTDSTGTRVASTNIDSAQNHIYGRITATIPPRSSVLFDYDLHVKPINEVVAIACENSVPQVSVTTPPWASTSLTMGSVDKNVCTPPSITLPKITVPGVFFGGILGLAAGYGLGKLF